MSARDMTVAFTLNGRRVLAACAGDTTALELLREGLGLTGTRDGCAVGECGACTILLDGVPALACLMLATELGDRRVTTIEGTRDARVERMRSAFLRESAVQCGFCTPGMILAASRLPRNATDEDIREALAGHVCRCTGYAAIVRAVRRALEEGPGDG